MKKGFRYYLGFNDTWLRVLGIPVLGFLMPMIFFGGSFGQWESFWPSWFSATLYSAIYWHVDLLITVWCRKRWPSYSEYPKRLAWQAAAIVGFTLSFCSITGLLPHPPALEHSVLHALQPPLDQIIYASLTATITILAVYEARYAYGKWRDSLIESERLRKETMQAQLETLKNQVNPHFLFNSLNTLATIIPEDPPMAVEFVQKLSKVYRYILEIRQREMITLCEELECIEAYKFLLDIRFGSNLTIDLQIPEGKKHDHIVPLSLQILIENAIKHNVVSTAKPLRIAIEVNAAGNLVVTNNLQKKQRVADSTGTGLANIDSRYKLLTGRGIDIITTQEHFRVVVPLATVSNYDRTDN